LSTCQKLLGWHIFGDKFWTLNALYSRTEGVVASEAGRSAINCSSMFSIKFFLSTVISDFSVFKILVVTSTWTFVCSLNYQPHMWWCYFLYIFCSSCCYQHHVICFLSSFYNLCHLTNTLDKLLQLKMIALFKHVQVMYTIYISMKSNKKSMCSEIQMWKGA
jgi:hypothetical protein